MQSFLLGLCWSLGHYWLPWETELTPAPHHEHLLTARPTGRRKHRLTVLQTALDFGIRRGVSPRCGFQTGLSLRSLSASRLGGLVSEPNPEARRSPGSKLPPIS